MLKKSKLLVRSHAEERQWLLGLGDGDIVQGVRNLAQQLKDASPSKPKASNSGKSGWNWYRKNV